ncbi:MAG: EamA family transporter [Methylococcales bacterium]
MIIYTLLVFFCSFLYGLSAVLCKHGLQSNAAIRSMSFKKLLLHLVKNRIWILGVCLSFATNLAIVEMQSFIDISVVYPILNFSYIFVLLLGYAFLHENLNKRQWIGIITVTIGTLLIIFVEKPGTGSDTIIERLLAFSAFSILAICAVVFTVYRKKVENYEIYYALCTGLSFGNVETYIKANTNMVISELGQFSIFSLDSLYYFISLWPFATMILFSVVGWLCMQITYSHGNVSVSVPLFAILQSCVTLSCGYFVFGEYFSFQKILGITTIVLGVIMLVLSSVADEQEIKAV